MGRAGVADGTWMTVLIIFSPQALHCLGGGGCEDNDEPAGAPDPGSPGPWLRHAARPSASKLEMKSVLQTIHLPSPSWCSTKPRPWSSRCCLLDTAISHHDHLHIESPALAAIRIRELESGKDGTFCHGPPPPRRPRRRYPPRHSRPSALSYPRVATDYSVYTHRHD